METPAILLLFTVSLIWGFTNPLMKRGATGIEKCSSVGSSWIQTFLHEIKFLLMNWKYLSAYLLNQCGSLLYYYTLGMIELSIASPLTNTLTFVFTYLAGNLLFGEKDEDSCLEKKVGIVLICSGVLCCIYDKL